MGHIATGLRIGDDPVDPRVPRRHRVARLRGDGPHPIWGPRTARSATASPSTTPPTTRSTPRRGSSTSSASCAGSCATTACPTVPRAPAPTSARSCCSTARCSTIPRSRAVSAPSTRRSPRPTTTIVDLAPDGEHDRWRAHLVGVATRLDPFTYGDAAIVAQRLHAITSRRPRLAFDDELVGAVRARMVVGTAADHVVGDGRARPRRRRGQRLRPRRRSTLRK